MTSKTTTRKPATITIALDTDPNSGSVFWGAARGDNRAQALRDAVRGFARASVPEADQPTLDTVTIPWPSRERLPNGQDRRALRLVARYAFLGRSGWQMRAEPLAE